MGHSRAPSLDLYCFNKLQPDMGWVTHHHLVSRIKDTKLSINSMNVDMLSHMHNHDNERSPLSYIWSILPPSSKPLNLVWPLLKILF